MVTNLKDAYHTSQDHEGKFTWSDGKSVTTAFWQKGQPDNYGGNQDCAVVNYVKPGLWDDQTCDLKNAFVCKSYSSQKTEDSAIPMPLSAMSPSQPKSYTTQAGHGHR